MHSDKRFGAEHDYVDYRGVHGLQEYTQNELTGYDDGESHEILLEGLNLMHIFWPLLGDETEPLWTVRQLSTKYQSQVTPSL